MALAKEAVAFFVVTMALCSVSLGAVYEVGDSAGWTSTGVDYQKWAFTKSFNVGDSLVFVYNNQLHNVRQVAQQDFVSCNGVSPLAGYATGSDTITLNTPGHYYFICGFPGHCQAGQKVDILVTPGSTVPGTNPNSPACGPSTNGTSCGPSTSGTVPMVFENSASSMDASKFWVALGLLVLFPLVN